MTRGSTTPNSPTPDALWHVDPKLLVGYVAGALGRTHAASVEAHLVTCAQCRAAMVPLSAPDRVARNLVAIADRVDQPRRHLIERIAGQLGVPEHISRVLAVTPSDRAPWFAGVAMALLVAALTARADPSERVLFVVLVAAPLLPLSGITAAAALHRDPLRELAVSVPTTGFKLFLIRALAVLTPTIGLAAAAALLLPDSGWRPVLWLLPSFGLVTGALALSRWFPVRGVAWTLGGAWVLAAIVASRGAPSAGLIESYAAFRPLGQLALLVMSLVAGTVVVLRRDSFDFVNLGRTA